MAEHVSGCPGLGGEEGIKIGRKEAPRELCETTGTFYILLASVVIHVYAFVKSS